MIKDLRSKEFGEKDRASELNRCRSLEKHRGESMDKHMFSILKKVCWDRKAK